MLTFVHFYKRSARKFSFGFLFLSLVYSGSVCSQDKMKLTSGPIYDVHIISDIGGVYRYNLWDSAEVKTIRKKFVRTVQYEYYRNQKVSFSLSIGFVPVGTQSGIRDIMEKYGYSGTVTSWLSWGGGGTDYPLKRMKLPVSAELEFLLFRKTSVSLVFSRTNDGSVEGLTPMTHLNDPVIEFRNPQVEIIGGFYGFSYKSKLEFGGLINFSTLTESDPSSGAILWKSSKTSAGFHLGYKVFLIRKKHAFLNCLGQFRYAGKNGITGGEFKGEVTGLNNLYFGIQAGAYLVRGN